MPSWRVSVSASSPTATYGLPSVIVKLVTLTGCVAVMLVVVRFRSLPEVPTFPSTIAVPPEVERRNHVAVPVAFALESCVIALSVRTPAAAPGANVALHVSSARSVVAAPPVAGREPSYIRRSPEAPTAAVISSRRAVRCVFEYARAFIQPPFSTSPSACG